jgi:AcrR family transcriptional regulator
MAKNPDSQPPAVNGYKHGRVPRDVRRSQLLELAEPLFMEKGYAGFSIDDLCRAAGVSRPIVYEHFGSKDGIYIACLRVIRDELDQALLAAAADGSDLRSTVQSAAEAWFAIVQRDPQRWSLVYGGTTGLVGPLADQLAELRDATVAKIGLVARHYAPDASAEEVSAWAHSVSGAGEQLGRWWLRNPRIPRKRVVAFYSDFLYAAANHLIEASNGNGSSNGSATRKAKAGRAKQKAPDPA